MKLWVVCGFVCRKLGFAIGGNMMTRIQNKLEERNALVDTVGIKSADLEDKIFVLAFCGFPNCLDVQKGRKLPFVD